MISYENVTALFATLIVEKYEIWMNMEYEVYMNMKYEGRVFILTSTIRVLSHEARGFVEVTSCSG